MKQLKEIYKELVKDYNHTTSKILLFIAFTIFAILYVIADLLRWLMWRIMELLGKVLKFCERD